MEVFAEVDKFSLLEAKINKIIQETAELKADNERLQESINIKENEIRGLKDRISQLEQEREMILGKIDVLLGKLEEV